MKQDESKTQASIKFLIATDVHLGHKQNHIIRKNDSFNAFEEVLSIAQEQCVDFLLLGGDLFDQVNPSQKTIYKCLDILQHYVQGQGNKNLKAKWLGNDDFRINFQNQNINIRLPIFTIHGNHDYPSNDFGKISICDLLHVSNYANYFGKHTSLAQIIIKPIVIEKQNVRMKIAIYGLGYIKDNILNDLFEQKKVKFLQLQNKSEYFCLFIFHQNRYKKGLRPGAPSLKCINSKYIPQWMDLTIWGHQHQAINKIEIQDQRQIFQPGSTIITSFIEAEAFPKQSLLIQIGDNGKIDLNPVPLKKSYRPMVCKNYEISQLCKNDKKFDIYQFLDNELNTIIENMQSQFGDKKSIVRLKVEYSGFQIGHCKILQNKYSQKVANPESILTFWKRKQAKIRNDNQVFQALRQKGSLDDQFKQITQQILMRYMKAQQNQQLYYNPKDIFHYTQNSIQKDLLNSQENLKVFFNKQMEKKSKPMTKQIDNIYKDTMKQIQNQRKFNYQKIQSNLKLDSSDEQINQKDISQIDNENKHQSQWQNHKKFILLKEDQLKKANVFQNFGENLLFYQQKHQNVDNLKRQSMTQKINKVSERQKGSVPNSKINAERSTLSNFIRKQPSDKPMKMQVEQKQKRNRTGILKRSNLQLSDYQNQCQSEQDCCKRAQKTQFNEQSTKNNFVAANKKAKDNKNRNKNKDLKVKDQVRVQKKKKSVRFSDSDFQ